LGAQESLAGCYYALEDHGVLDGVPQQLSPEDVGCSLFDEIGAPYMDDCQPLATTGSSG